MKADYKFGNLAIFIPWFVNNDCKQESIPVGCIQTTVVTATDVRTWEGSTYWSGVCLLGGCLALRGSALHPIGWTMGQTTPPSPRMDHGKGLPTGVGCAY